MSTSFKVGDRVNVPSYGKIVAGTIYKIGEHGGTIFYITDTNLRRWCFPESATLIEEEEEA